MSADVMVLLVESPALESPRHAEMPSLLSAVRIQTASSSSAAALVLGTLDELYAEDMLRHSSPPLRITYARMSLQYIYRLKVQSSANVRKTNSQIM